MKQSSQICMLCMALFMSFIPVSTPLSAQERIPALSSPINIDEALKEPVTQNRATSYYYFALARWSEIDGNLDKALSQMKKALDYNSDSSDIHLELARLLGKMGRSQEALSHAGEASRLNPKDPNPHWLMYRIYRNTQPSMNGEFEKAVRELEIIQELDPQNGGVYFGLGSAYFDLNEPEKAVQAFEKYQSLTPDSISGYLELAKYFYTNENPEKAVEYLKKALELQPESIDILNFLGGVYIELNRVQAAIPMYEKLAQLIGNDLDLKYRLASLYYEDGEYREAGDLLDDILRKTPENIEARILEGRIQTELNEYEKAIETFESIKTDDPEMARRVEFHKGITYKSNNEYSKAIDIFEKLLSDSPNKTEEDQNNRLLFQYHLTPIYLKLGENDKAVSTARKGYEENPNNMRMGIFYAQTLADTGDPGMGIEVLKELLASNPSEIDLYIYLSQIYLQDKLYPEAENILQQAEKLEIADSDVLEKLKIQRVSVYEKQKDYDRAESLLAEILEENPNHAGALNYYGYMLADRGVSLDKALKYVKKALEIEPDNGAYLDSLGWAYFKLNDLKNAEIYLLEAGKREKDDPVINDHLGDLYFRTGDLEKAYHFWMKSVRISTEQEEIQKVRKKLNKLPKNISEKQPTK